MRRQATIDSQPQSRRRAAPARRSPALELTCAQIGMMLDAPRGAPREQTTQGGGEGREGPSVVDTLFGCCRSQQKS